MRARSLLFPGFWLGLAAALIGAAPALRAQGPAPAAAPEGTGSLEIPAGDLSGDQIESLYRQILSRWSAGDAERAPTDLIALESAVVQDADPRTKRALLKAEQAVIHEVAKADLEVLVPIAMLHHETYRLHLERPERGRALAMGHTRQMARDLAILYREQSGSEGAGRVASQLLTSLGAMLQEHAQLLPAAELFQQAIELDGGNVAALLALATIYEKNSQYETTVKNLRRLLEVAPQHPEGQLRLAVNLRRLASRDAEAEARRLLEGLAAADASWVGPLAVQELARMLGEAGAADAAEKALRAGLARFPEEARLSIQLAALLDRKGVAKESAALVEKVLAAQGERGASGRYLYNTVRPDAFAEGRSFLAETARARLTLLDQALAAGAGAAAAEGEAGS
jgi:tetratricopeptide (TPR) repeat protein